MTTSTEIPSTSERPQASSRVRRPFDLLLALGAFLVLSVILATIDGLPTGSNELSDDVTRGVHTVPHWLTVSGSFVALVASLLLALLVINALVRRDPLGALNAVVSAAVKALREAYVPADEAAIASVRQWNRTRDVFGSVPCGPTSSTLMSATHGLAARISDHPHDASAIGWSTDAIAASSAGS